jgi:hypothetical protein
MTRKRLFKELSKSISVRVPKSKAKWMLPHIKDYIRHLEGGGKPYIQLLVLLRERERTIEILQEKLDKIYKEIVDNELTPEELHDIIYKDYEED